MDRFLEKLGMLPEGYLEGQYRNRRYGVTMSMSEDGRRAKLFGEELGGNDIVSFNLYRLSTGQTRLKPCEMPSQKVIDFVLGFEPEQTVVQPAPGRA